MYWEWRELRSVLSQSFLLPTGTEQLSAECYPMPQVDCLFVCCTTELCLLMLVARSPDVTIAFQAASVSLGRWNWPPGWHCHPTTIQFLLRHCPRDGKMQFWNLSATREAELRIMELGSYPSFWLIASLWKKTFLFFSLHLFSDCWSGSSTWWSLSMPQSWGSGPGAHHWKTSALPRLHLTHLNSISLTEILLSVKLSWITESS